MSRIGKLPVAIPAGVTLTVDGNVVKVKGPNGELSHKLPDGISVAREGDTLNVNRASEETNHKSLHGLTRSLIANMVEGGPRATRSSSRSRASASRRKCGRMGCSSRLGSRTRSSTRRRPGSSSPRRSRPRSRSRDRTRHWWVRSPPSCAVSVRPSRTRAKEFVTPAKSFAARPVRRGASNHARYSKDS